MKSVTTKLVNTPKLETASIIFGVNDLPWRSDGVFCGNTEHL
jgi:hypothetical protein